MEIIPEWAAIRIFLARAEGIDTVVNETISLTNSSSTYSGTITLPRQSTHFCAILKHHEEPVLIPPKPPQPLWEEDAKNLAPSITSHWRQTGHSTRWDKLNWLITSTPKRSHNTEGGALVVMRTSLQQCVGSGCQAVGQRRAPINPDQNNHHGTCCKAEEVHMSLIFHPKHLLWFRASAVWETLWRGWASALLPLPVPSQALLLSLARGARAARRKRMREESSSEMKLAV